MIRLLLNCVARIGLVALATLSVCSAYGASAHRFKKILIVVLENTDFSQAKKQPFLAALAHKGGAPNRILRSDSSVATKLHSPRCGLCLRSG
jgi:hypothetical protein